MCIFLFTLANVIKAFIAKLIATHFHKEQYFERMQAALRKVRPHLLPTDFAGCPLQPLWVLFGPLSICIAPMDLEEK